jgi:sulfur-oxidizing protein SoxY
MITRRSFLLLSLLSTTARAQLPPNIGEIRKQALDEAIRKVVGGQPVRAGRVKLDLPPLIDNGNVVALSVSVDSPMTATDYVKAIHVFNEKNPQPNIVSVMLGPRAGRASISTRIRLADSQTVIAIAQLSDGSFWQTSQDVIVTIAACAEELS